MASAGHWPAFPVSDPAGTKTEVVIVTRPFQPAMFQVDGQLHSQDVGSVTLRDRSVASVQRPALQ